MFVQEFYRGRMIRRAVKHEHDCEQSNTNTHIPIHSEESTNRCDAFDSLAFEMAMKETKICTHENATNTNINFVSLSKSNSELKSQLSFWYVPIKNMAYR